MEDEELDCDGDVEGEDEGSLCGFEDDVGGEDEDGGVDFEGESYASDDDVLADILGGLSLASRRCQEDQRLKKLWRADDVKFSSHDALKEERLAIKVFDHQSALDLARTRGDTAEGIASLVMGLEEASDRLSRHEERARGRRLGWAADVQRASARVGGDPESAQKLARMIRTLEAWAWPGSSWRPPDVDDIVKAACDLAARRFAGRLARAVRARARLTTAVAIPGNRDSPYVKELRQRCQRRDERVHRLEERLLYVTKPARINWDGDAPAIEIPAPPAVLGFLDRLVELNIPRPNLLWVEAELNDHIVEGHFFEQFYDLAEPVKALWGRAEPAAGGYIRPAVRRAIMTLWDSPYGAEPSVAARLYRELDDMDGEEHVHGADAGSPPEATPAARCAAQGIVRAIAQGFLCHPRPAPPDAAGLLRGVEDAVIAEAEAASQAARRDRQRERRRSRREAEDLAGEANPVAGGKRLAAWPPDGGGQIKKPKGAGAY